jgi:hypothetical protein
MAWRENDKLHRNFRTARLSGATKPHTEGAMQRFIPALKIVLMVCVAFLATVTVLGLVFGAEKPFWAIMPIFFGLFAFQALSTWTGSTPDCPTCGTRQPAQRKPASFRQLMWGGWTCRECNTEIDRHGKAMTPAS